LVKRGKDPESGKPIIIFEDTPERYTWTYEEYLDKLAEELFPTVREDRSHPARGKTLRQLVIEDTEDHMGWGEYKEGLKKLGLL